MVVYKAAPAPRARVYPLPAPTPVLGGDVIPEYGKGYEFPKVTADITGIVNAVVAPMTAIPADFMKASMDITGDLVAFTMAIVTALIQLPIWMLNFSVQMFSSFTGTFAGGLGGIAK